MLTERDSITWVGKLSGFLMRFNGGLIFCKFNSWACFNYGWCLLSRPSSITKFVWRPSNLERLPWLNQIDSFVIRLRHLGESSSAHRPYPSAYDTDTFRLMRDSHIHWTFVFISSLHSTSLADLSRMVSGRRPVYRSPVVPSAETRPND